MFKRLRSFIVFLFAAWSLVACTERDLSTEAPVVDGTNQQTIFFATQRNIDQTGLILGEQRFEKLHYGHIDVSLPPNHETGKIEWCSSNPDPSREFAITRYTQTDDVGQFLNQLDSAKTDDPDETIVFVHGYTTAAEAVFRLGQIQKDFGLIYPSVLFTWPSAGQASGYVYVRDSVLFARDNPEAVLSDLTRGNKRVFLVAHSLDTHLVIETLCQARSRGNDRMLNRLSGAVLMSPDIDPNLFNRQVEAIGDLPQPFFVVWTQQDRSLGLPSFVTGQKMRVGQLFDSEVIGRDDVAVQDFSDFVTDSQLNHSVLVSSSTTISFLRSVLDVIEDGGEDFESFVSSARQKLGGSIGHTTL